jgi:DNA repair exonuclease SbcCD ATPase subunit
LDQHVAHNKEVQEQLVLSQDDLAEKSQELQYEREKCEELQNTLEVRQSETSATIKDQLMELDRREAKIEELLQVQDEAEAMHS